jgi:hypothetical protein
MTNDLTEALRRSLARSGGVTGILVAAAPPSRSSSPTSAAG